MTTSSGRLSVRPGLVHVWRFALNVPDETLAGFEPILSEDERVRADRFRRKELRRKFVAGRGTLRAILGSYLGAEPSSLVFRYERHGKPVLTDTGLLQFNLAHSGSMALCALSAGQTLGVDVEEHRPMENAERIIGRYFTPREQADFLAHSSGDRLSAFYRGWTRKEAFLKATGDGLSASLDSFEVSLATDSGRGVPLLLRVGDDPGAAGRWAMRDVPVPDGYAAAVAVAGVLEEVVVRDWPERR